MSRNTLQLSEVVFQAIEMQKNGNLLDEEPLIRLMLELQENMDYDNMVIFLIKH